MKRGGGRILDGGIDGAIRIVGRACVDFGRAEFSAGTVIVEKKIEGGRDEGRVGVELPQGAKVDPLLAEDAERIGLGEAAGDVSFAAEVVLCDREFCPWIEVVDGGLDLREKG